MATTPFRIRSYRRAAEALEGHPQQVSELLDEPKNCWGFRIGKGMAANIRSCAAKASFLSTGTAAKYRPACWSC